MRSNRPHYAVLCWSERYCNSNDWLLTDFDIADVINDISNLVIFRLHEDLSVELLRELPPELGLDDRGTYDPDRLIDASVPLPPRAVTMLGAAKRRQLTAFTSDETKSVPIQVNNRRAACAVRDIGGVVGRRVEQQACADNRN